MLGAIADGDIGEHFPPTDPQWKGASSDRFLSHAVGRVAAKGGRILNADVTLICDSMAGQVMREGRIQRVFVGADRIAANGDTANKIGTYSVAVLARENKIPFYVAAPISTLDLSIKSGDEIPIEERHSREVTHLHGFPVAPDGIRVRNPAFDVTPARYIAGIITEKGVVRGDYERELKALVGR